MTSISLLASKPTTIDAAAIRDMDAKRRVEAALVLQLVPGFLIAGARSIMMARIGDAAAAILADGNDDDHTGRIAQALNSDGDVDTVITALRRKADAIHEADENGILDAYSTADLLRMSTEIGSIIASLQAWRTLIDYAPCSDAEDLLRTMRVGRRAIAIIEQTIAASASALAA
jgi:hypothetical protein